MTTLSFEDGIARNRAGAGFAFTSVCSAHPDVLAASLRMAARLGLPLIVEATSNQVNQFGGYTGMQPADFIARVHALAAEVGAPTEGLIFGGDHLGPQAWKELPAEEAMGRAEDMMRAYVAAGFTKIHLDCSEGCAGEPAHAGDALAASRAAQLAAICEAEAGDRAHLLSYIVGTEVPPPGGARAGEDEGIHPTPPENAARTLEAHRAAFAGAGLEDAWSRVRGLVVQPGLEFAPAHIDRFDMEQPDLLSPVLDGYGTLSFEAHSTDYQAPDVFRALGQRHFAVLKVGPALTFAYREAVYALSAIDGWMTGAAPLPDLLERKMTGNPGYWQKHYDGDETRLRLLRHFGYADRIRYYWAEPEVEAAVAALRSRIDAGGIPDPLIEQYVDAGWRDAAERLRTEGLGLSAALIHARIERALAPYLEVIL